MMNMDESLERFIVHEHDLARVGLRWHRDHVLARRALQVDHTLA